MKKLLTMMLIGFGLLSNESYSNGLSLNSIGTRALGMGGAFVGLADDATAIYWNPAGLANVQGGYIGVSVLDVMPMATYKNTAANINTETKFNHYISPSIMGYWDCMLMKDLKIGLGVYVPAGLGAEWEGNDLKLLSNGNSYTWKSKIGVLNFSPAISYKLLDNLSLGMAMNIYYGMFDLSRPATMTLQTGNKVDGQYEESSTGLGYGVTFGALYTPIKELSIGASLRTKTAVSMSGDATNTMFGKLNLPTKSDFDRDVNWPLWIAGGVAVRPMEGLTLTLDAQWSQWSSACDEFTTEFKDATWKAATEPTEQNKFKLHWKDALQVRFGAEYKVNEDLAIRCGAYHDPAPAPDETYNILFPDITYKAITLGATYNLGKFSIDFGTEYLFGEERDIKQATETVGGATMPSNLGGIHNCDIFALTLGLGYKF